MLIKKQSIYFTLCFIILAICILWFWYIRPHEMQQVTCLPIAQNQQNQSIPSFELYSSLANTALPKKITTNICHLVSTNGTTLGTFFINTAEQGKLQPFQLVFRPHNVQQTEYKRYKVSVTITGINEYMGVHVYPLTHSPNKHYHYDGVLPVCTVQNMQWRAKLYVTPEKNHQEFFALLDFSTTRFEN